jgi:ABC-type nickel/cobalt efflux system permease component RcnA
MKRFLLISCAFLVVFAGVAAAWESCKEISFLPDDHHRSASAHKHDHHSPSDRHHSSNNAIHCPPMGDYLPTATFTISPDNRIERFPETLVGELDSQFIDHGLYRLIHGPPGSAHSRIIPPYLMLSVLRI